MPENQQNDLPLTRDAPLSAGWFFRFDGGAFQRVLLSAIAFVVIVAALSEAGMNRSFDRMRQYLASDRTASLHALGVLSDVANAASRKAMADACVQQMHRLARSTKELQAESAAHVEIDAALARALGHGDRG